MVDLVETTSTTTSEKTPTQYAAHWLLTLADSHLPLFELGAMLAVAALCSAMLSLPLRTCLFR